MTLDEKRKVIEVLLCSVALHGRQTTWDTCRILGHPDRGVVAMLANQLWHQAFGRRYNDASHSDICLEAAYRLISSSPQLRREFFGRGAK